MTLQWWRRILTISTVAPGLALADTIQLKDQAAVTGKILTEKKDAVYLDVGYTVLNIPKNQIVKVTRSVEEEPEPAPTRTKATAPTESPDSPAHGLFAVATGSEPQRSVSD